MTEVIGTHNTAKVFTDNLEEKSRGQIEALCNMAEFADSKIRIMSDVHAGAGCTIGTTMTITNRVVPGMVATKARWRTRRWTRLLRISSRPPRL